ncbi:MAG: carbohydrate-binding family 9-like protein [Candidatus Methylacidiphilales bacterium]
MPFRVLIRMFLVLILTCGAASSNTPKKSQPPLVNVTSHTPALFQLSQPWRKEPDPLFRPASVELTWSPEVLRITADLTDDEIFSRSTADQQRMWELGDVFEIFLQVGGRRDYIELHVTPHNHRMHLHLPGVGRRATPESDPLPFEKLLLPSVGFTSSARLTTGSWQVQATVPASVLNFEMFTKGTELRISFCRYDAYRERKPILSTTSPHPVIDFHRPHEWIRVILD